MTRPSDEIWALVSGLPRLERERRALMVLQAFIDESHARDPAVYVMGGFIADSKRWAAFSDEWRQFLDMKPAIKTFKMKDAMNLEGEFRWWRPEARDEKLKLLIGVISDHAQASVMAAVRHDHFEALFKNRRTLPAAFKLTPYAFLAGGLIQQLAHKEHEIGINGPVDFIFDEQVMEETALMEQWGIIKQIGRAPPHLLGGPPIFRSDERVLPLQAADLLAGFHRANLQSRLRGDGPLQLPKAAPGKKEVPLLQLFWAPDKMEELAQFLDRPDKSKITGTFGKYVFSVYDPMAPLPSRQI